MVPLRHRRRRSRHTRAAYRDSGLRRGTAPHRDRSVLHNKVKPSPMGRVLDCSSVDETIRAGIREARKAEWGKWRSFRAVAPTDDDILERLKSEGQRIVATRWVDTDMTCNRREVGPCVPVLAQCAPRRPGRPLVRASHKGGQSYARLRGLQEGASCQRRRHEHLRARNISRPHLHT